MAAETKPPSPTDGTEPIWKALSDSTRRALLDLLRERPRTTGELAAAFPTSRFAVMKHLAVLGEAGLVVSRKEGRERWHHLNAIPLQEVHERWVSSYQAHWARGLVQLRKHVEGAPERSHQEETMGENGKSKAAGATCGIARVELEIPIGAPRDWVWRALTEEMGVWWRKDFYVNQDARFVMEPRVGGRIFEDLGDGAGALWFTITSFVPGKRLELAGNLFPEFGGPSTSLVRMALTDDGATTKLTLSDAVFGRVDEKTEKSLTEGWNLLLGEALKSHCEGAGA